MSRQGVRQLGLLVSRHSFSVTTVMLRHGLASCRDMTFVSQQRRFNVRLKSVMIEFSLSR